MEIESKNIIICDKEECECEFWNFGIKESKSTF